MKTSLQGSMEGWFAARKGHIPFWKLTENGQVLVGHTGDINFLIDTANKYLKKNDLKKMPTPSFEHLFGYSLGVWLEYLVEKGFTNHLLKELRQALKGIRFFHELMPAIPSRGKPMPHWEYVADMGDFSSPETVAAYAFSQQLTLDGFSGLKRCEMQTCEKFFIGRPNAKWCSKNCGSKHRVREKRKKDRQ